MTEPNPERPPKTMLMRPEPVAEVGACPMLVVVEGLEPGRRHLLQAGETTIGRGGENQLVLPSPAVSNVHASIAAHDGQFWIRDLRSTNGVTVNGIAVPVDEPRLLGNGDAIRLSDHLLLFHHGAAWQESSSSAIVIDRADVARQVDELLQQVRPPQP